MIAPPPAAHPVKRVLRAAGLRRSRAAAVRMCCERNVMTALHRRNAAPRSRILCYHSVGTPEWGNNDVSPRRFREQLESALHLGYRFVPASIIANGAGAPKDLAVTFDDGVRSVATNAAPILRELGIPWTLFVVTAWADGHAPFHPEQLLGWREVERLANDGATIASHSVTHPNFGRLAPDSVVQELEASRRTLESRLGILTAEFAIPMGQSADWTQHAMDAATSAGYTTVYAQSEERRAPGTVARTFVTRWDRPAIFRAALGGAFDRWEEWY